MTIRHAPALLGLSLALAAFSEAPLANAQAAAPCATIPVPVPPLEPPSLDTSVASPTQANLMTWVEHITDPRLLGRQSGSDQSVLLARSLAQQMADFGLTGAFAEDDFCQLFPLPGLGPDQNVAGRLAGSPEMADRPAVLVAAHYDSLGDIMGLHPGANDNASGTAALMEVARVVTSRRESWPFDIVFVAFGAQLGGRFGSQAFVGDPPVELDDVALLIEIEMVGSQLFEGHSARLLLGNPDDTVGYMASTSDFERLDGLAGRAAEAAGVRVLGVSEALLAGVGYSSDATSFEGRVPSLVISTGLTDVLHTPQDTVDRLDVAQIERAARLVVALLEGLRRDLDTPPE